MLTDSKVTALKPPAKGQREYPDTKVTGLRLRVGAGGSKTWIFRARTGDRTINKKIGAYPAVKLADARNGALKLIAALARDGSAEALERTFGAVADYWIEKVARPRNHSWHLQQRRLEMHVLPAWRNRKIASIRRGEVRDLLDGLEGAVIRPKPRQRSQYFDPSRKAPLKGKGGACTERRAPLGTLIRGN